MVNYLLLWFEYLIMHIKWWLRWHLLLLDELAPPGYLHLWWCWFLFVSQKIFEALINCLLHVIKLSVQSGSKDIPWAFDDRIIDSQSQLTPVPSLDFNRALVEFVKKARALFEESFPFLFDKLLIELGHFNQIIMLFLNYF